MKRDFILPAEKGSLLAYLAALPAIRKFRVTVKLYRPSRTDPQNKALWGVAYPAIRKATGNDSEDLHVYFCGSYFGWQEVGVLDQIQKKPIRTTTRNEEGERDVMSTTDFMDFYAFIQARCASIGVHVPDPDPELRKVAA